MFTLNNNDTTPLYRQLFQQIREQILSGKLPGHFKLPSVRDLAAELVTSRNTVEGAYQELCAEGYLYSKPRSGYFVTDLEQRAASLPLPQPPSKRGRQPRPDACYRYDFHPARIDPESFPATLWRRCLLNGLRAIDRELTQYGDPQGEWGLRCNIQQYLEHSRGVCCEPDQIVICSGLQHSLEIVAHLIKDGHAAVAVENPGYHLPRDVFRNHGLNVIPIDIGPSGLNLNTLRSSDGTVAYITPSHQMPLGHVMPVANRLKLIEWAEKGGNLIIEDDYDSELRYHGRPISSLQGLCSQQSIIYLGTFSKILSPALRLSYMVLPRSLLATYRRRFENYQSTVSLLEQRTMTTFMEQGHWEQHVRRMRVLYKKKHDVMLQAIEQYFGRKSRVVGQGAGLHVVLQLSGTLTDEAMIIDRSKGQGIRLLAFSDFYTTGRPDAIKLLLGFGGMNASEIQRGINLLSQLCF